MYIEAIEAYMFIHVYTCLIFFESPSRCSMVIASGTRNAAQSGTFTTVPKQPLDDPSISLEFGAVCNSHRVVIVMPFTFSVSDPEMRNGVFEDVKHCQILSAFLSALSESPKDHSVVLECSRYLTMF